MVARAGMSALPFFAPSCVVMRGLWVEVSLCKKMERCVAEQGNVGGRNRVSHSEGQSGLNRCKAITCCYHLVSDLGKLLDIKNPSLDTCKLIEPSLAKHSQSSFPTSSGPLTMAHDSNGIAREMAHVEVVSAWGEGGGEGEREREGEGREEWGAGGEKFVGNL